MTEAKSDTPITDFCMNAAVSYTKHCGAKAEECAEADLLGEALKVVERIDYFGAALIAHEWEPGSISIVELVADARAVLAKLPQAEKGGD